VSLATLTARISMLVSTCVFNNVNSPYEYPCMRAAYWHYAIAVDSRVAVGTVCLLVGMRVFNFFFPQLIIFSVSAIIIVVHVIAD
jgi:hypothetical protein